MIIIALALLQAAPVKPQYVFFDWGKSEITRDASSTLDEFTREYRDGMRIRLIGHSDRSGSALSNIRSSQKRAEMVRDYLKGKGVPAEALVLSGAGETSPIVATADGVREVQNRRVEITVDQP